VWRPALVEMAILGFDDADADGAHLGQPAAFVNVQKHHTQVHQIHIHRLTGRACGLRAAGGRWRAVG
jgi:hypothetical protein